MRKGAAGQSLQDLIILLLSKPAGGCGGFPLTSEHRGADTETEDSSWQSRTHESFFFGSTYKRWFISNVLFPYQFWLLVELNKGHLWHFFLRWKVLWIPNDILAVTEPQPVWVVAGFHACNTCFLALIYPTTEGETSWVDKAMVRPLNRPGVGSWAWQVARADIWPSSSVCMTAHLFHSKGHFLYGTCCASAGQSALQLSQ